MVDPRRSSDAGSGGGKRRSSSSPPPYPCSPTKRSKAEVKAKVDTDTEKPEEEAPVAAAAEAGTSSRSAVAAGKRPAPLNVQNTPPPAATGLQAVEPPPVPWARLISQNNQISHVLMFGTEFSVGGSETCNIFLKDHNASRVLCKLCRLEQPSGCCQLEVTGKKGVVELNGAKIKKACIELLMGGDEIAFCRHAFIFQPYNRVPISASATLPPSGYQIFKDGLKQGILGPDAIQFTLEDFPYYLSLNTKSVLLSAAFIHMKKKFTESLSGILSLNQRILLSGPCVNELHPDSSVDQEVEILGIHELIEVMWEESISSPLVVLVKDVEKALTGRTESHASLGKELPPGVLIIGSHTEKDSLKDKMQGSPGSILQARNKDATNSMMHLNNLFPHKISIELPKDEAQLSELKKQLRVDAQSLRAKANALIVRKFLTARGMECENIEEFPIKDHLLTHEEVDKVVGRSFSYHLEHNKL